jgi:hypothetical protein
VKLTVIDVNEVVNVVTLVGAGVNVIEDDEREFTVVFGNCEYITILLYNVPAVKPVIVIELLVPAIVLVVITCCPKIDPESGVAIA